jgi:hypothetical protein
MECGIGGVERKFGKKFGKIDGMETGEGRWQAELL